MEQKALVSENANGRVEFWTRLIPVNTEAASRHDWETIRDLAIAAAKLNSVRAIWRHRSSTLLLCSWHTPYVDSLLQANHHARQS